MKKFLKKYWLLIFLAFIASLLLSLFLINRQIIVSQKSEKEDLFLLPAPKITSYPVKVRLDFSNLLSNFPSLPLRENVYEFSNPSYSNEEAMVIAKKLEFNTQPISENYNGEVFLSWKEEERYLSINLKKGSIEFSNTRKDLFLPVPSLLPNINNIEPFAKSFLQEKGLLPKDEVNIIIVSKSYLESFGEEYEEVNKNDNAFAIQAKIEFQLKDINLTGIGINLVVGKNNEVIKFNSELGLKNVQLLTSYPLKEKKEVIQIIQKADFINFINIPNNYLPYEEIKQLREISFNKIEVVYLKTSPTQNYLQPIFFISGQGTLIDGRTSEIGIYIPAIKDEYLLK